MSSDAVDQLLALLGEQGKVAYGEDVTQVEHALQCAMLAEAEEVTKALVVAALLHDIGHLLYKDPGGALAKGQDDRHDMLGASYLKRWFGDEVTQPIAWHVEAKRYLCFVDPGYRARLSPVSQQSLLLQGNVMSAQEAATFLQLPFARDAIRLRQWDDAGKRPGVVTPSLEHFRVAVQACLVR